jgi:hypothetical protein
MITRKRFWIFIAVLLVAQAFAPWPALAGLQPAEYNIDDLRSAAGVAALTALLLGGLVKPWVKKTLGEEHSLYVPLINTATFAIALLLSFLGAVGLGFEYADLVNALLVAIVGFTSAVGGYEVARGNYERVRS